MEKPVRRKASFARYDAEGKQIKGHKSSQSSGSGAGAWMGKGKTNAGSMGKKDSVQVETQDGRKYHIPATAAAAAIRATDVQNQIIAKKDLGASESGDVDLDLSFDFVSKMERGKKAKDIQLEKENPPTPSTPPRRDLIDGEKNTTPIPRGMSSTDWGSRQRKKPPTPLSLNRRQREENERDLASQFSPDSPTLNANYDDEPLMIVPISATRRANDAGIQFILDNATPTVESNNNASMTNLIQQQRMAASKRQNVSQTSLSTKSPGKRKKVPKAEHSSPKKNVFLESSSKLGQKVPFGINQKANNAQIVRAEENTLFYDGRSEDVHSKSNGHSTDSEKRISNVVSSNYHTNDSHESAGSKGRRSRQLSARESIGSSNHSMPASFKTAHTQEVESSSSHGAFSNEYAPSPSAQNVLGLLFPADHVPVVPLIETTAPALATSEPSDGSPMLTQRSTPITPHSALFSDGGDNGESHGHSSLSSTGGRTPLTAISTLFGDRTEQDGKLKAESTSMIRGATTPNPISSIAGEVIREESSLSIDRPSSVPPSDSTKMQDGHNIQSRSRSSIETDVSSQGEQTKSMIVNTNPTPRKNQDSFDLTDITGTRAKKGPWSQSPLLLESEDSSKKRISTVGENIEMGFGLGLSLLGERDPEKFSKTSQGHSIENDLTVNRAESSHVNNNALGLQIGQTSSLHNVKENKILTKSPSTSSTLEGFSINVTPAIDEKKDVIKTPDHRVDVPSNVVDIEEILAAGNNAETRNRWSSKLWSVTSAFRSPIRSSFDVNNSAQSPPMRALTLVGKNQDGTSKSSSIRRSASKEDMKRSLSKKRAEESPAVDAYHSMPSSSVIDDQPTFSNETVTRPAAAMYSEARSSKHIKRASRIQYLKSGGEESHIQVDMDSTDAKTRNAAMEKAILEMIKSPRVADSPTGNTPHLEQFISNEDSKRKSWNVNTIANSSSNNKRSSWLVPKRQSHTGARDSELYALAANMRTMLSNAGESGIDQDSAAVEAMLSRSESQEDGLRRRANRRSMDDLPNTPTFIAEGFEGKVTQSYDEQMSTDQAQRQKTISFHASKYNAKGVSIAFEEPSIDHSSQRNHDHHSRLSAYSRPRSGMQFLRNLSTMQGSYDKPQNEQEYENSIEKENHYLHYKAGRMSVRQSASIPSRKRISGIFTPSASNTNGENSFFSYTGEALQKIKPSQTLFIAGFLFMPWLWFIGGWVVDRDGLFFIEHVKSFGPAQEPESNEEDHSRPSSSASDNPYNNSGRISRAGWYREDQHETGSIILHSEENLQTRRNRFSTMLWPDDNLFMNRFRNSGLMEAVRKQTRKGKGMGGALKRQQEKEQEYDPSEDNSITVQVAQKMFDCSKLDRYVILNRVMAIIASLIAFGGLGLAIAAIVIHF